MNTLSESSCKVAVSRVLQLTYGCSQGPLVNTEEGNKLQKQVWKEILSALQGVSPEVDQVISSSSSG